MQVESSSRFFKTTFPDMKRSGQELPHLNANGNTNKIKLPVKSVFGTVKTNGKQTR